MASPTAVPKQKLFSQRKFPVGKMAVGLLVGGLILLFVGRMVDFHQLGKVLLNIDFRLVGPALVFYWTAIAGRALRWRVLLRQEPPLRFVDVIRALIIGFAANNVLPAKLGELVRIDVLKRKTGIARSSALGSIVLERMQDSFMVLVVLYVGFMGSPVPVPTVIKTVALWGMLPLGILVLGVMGALIVAPPRFLNRWPRVAKLYQEFRFSLSNIWSGNFLRALLLACLIWSVDLLSTWVVLRSLHIVFDATGVMLLTGVYCLASLLPSAPGYVGSYQLAFVLVLGMYGLSPAQGVAAAFTMQVLFLLPLTLVGGVLYLSDKQLAARPASETTVGVSES